MNAFLDFLKAWGWAIAMFFILLIVFGNHSGCTEQVDLYKGAYQDLNSAYRKQQRAEESRQKYLNAADAFSDSQDSQGLGVQKNSSTCKSNSNSNCTCAECQKQAANTACCDSTVTVNYGKGNQIINLHVGDANTNAESKKKDETTKVAPSKTQSSGTKTIVVREPSVTNNYYGYSKAETDRTVQEAVHSRNVTPPSTSTKSTSVGTSSVQECSNCVIRITNPDGTKHKDFAWTKQGRRDALQFLKEHNLNYQGLPDEADLPD